jgi:hypothetical protein
MNPLWVAGCATAGRIWNKRSGGQPGRLIADNVERMIVYLNRRVPLANGKGTALVSAMDYKLVMQQKNVDHKNLDGLDNRRTNLRPAGPPDQAANHGKRADNTSGYIGVSWDKQYGKWRAQVRKNGKTVWSARFDDLEKAARARGANALEHYSEFAVLNFPRYRSRSLGSSLMVIPLRRSTGGIGRAAPCSARTGGVPSPWRGQSARRR